MERPNSDSRLRVRKKRQRSSALWPGLQASGWHLLAARRRQYPDRVVRPLAIGEDDDLKILELNLALEEPSHLLTGHRRRSESKLLRGCLGVVSRVPATVAAVAVDHGVVPRAISSSAYPDAPAIDHAPKNTPGHRERKADGRAATWTQPTGTGQGCDSPAPGGIRRATLLSPKRWPAPAPVPHESARREIAPTAWRPRAMGDPQVRWCAQATQPTICAQSRRRKTRFPVCASMTRPSSRMRKANCPEFASTTRPSSLMR